MFILDSLLIDGLGFVFDKIRVAAEAGKITFKDAAEHDVVIPLSFKGFGQAFDALSKE